MAYNPSSYVDNLRFTLKDFNDILLVAKKIGTYDGEYAFYDMEVAKRI
ncbi:hypothetical protein [Brevibacillus sp. Leaf182]|nr:hypothetical protein [Brevibacillus sp. Leaf182]